MKKQIIAGLICLTVIANISACVPFQFSKGKEEKEVLAVEEKEKLEEDGGKEAAEEVVKQEEVKEKEEEPKKESPSNTTSNQGNPTQNTVPTTVQYPLELCHSSGVGAWSSDIVIQADGTFTGSYHDSDMGTVGDEYPYGTEYISGFRGKFTNIQRIDQYSFSLTLETITLDNPIDKVYIEDGVRYVCTGAGGLTKNDGKTPARNFVLYVPGTPLSMLNEDFKMWYDMTWGYGSKNKQTLPIYGLRNLETEDGFFGE